MEKKIGFIGGGNIASAIINGIIQSKTVEEKNIFVFDKHEEKKEKFRLLGCNTVNNEYDTAKKSDYLFITVKPQGYDEVLEKIAEFLDDKTVIITVAPGITINHIREMTKNAQRVIRTMPNTPALVGEGVTAYCISDGFTDEEKNFVSVLLNSFSSAYEMNEKLLDPIISVSGSSPAYVYMFIDAIAQSAEAQGINYDTALTMAAKTVIGSAKLLLNASEPAENLIEKVCSKGGTTIRAVDSLKNDNFYEIINTAMKKCTERAIEMKR